MKDDEIIRKLIENYGGLISEVSTTNIQHKQLVQHDCTDWDFLLSRAEASGLLVVADQNKIMVQPPGTGAAAELKVTYGTNLMAFYADVDSTRHLSPVESSTSNPDSQDDQVGARLAHIEGHMTFPGNAQAKIGRLISVEGVGKQFSGEVFVSGVQHKLAGGNWVTEVEFGISQKMGCRTAGVDADPKQ